MTNRQFQLTDLVCPHCGHVIGKQAFFQSFETKVATWLSGETAPVATPGYDVCHCSPFPDLTFQVKYSYCYRFQAKDVKYPQIVWQWHLKRIHPQYPNYFILFGIDEQAEEHVFLLSRSEFINYASYYQNKYHLRVSAKLKSDRQNYNYVPKIWRYVVQSPETRLAEEIQRRLDFGIR